MEPEDLLLSLSRMLHPKFNLLVPPYMKDGCWIIIPDYPMRNGNDDKSNTMKYECESWKIGQIEQR